MILKSFIYIVVGLIILSLWGFYSGIRPFKITSSATPKDFGVVYENVAFYTQDNVLIKAWFVPSAKANAKTLILLHGYPADKANILPSMIGLYKNYNLLFMDFRYFGESGGHYSTIGKNEVLDLLAAIQYLHSRGINEVGVWGFSLGGSIALMAVSKAPEIKAIVSESAYARLDWMSYELYRIPLLKYPLGELTRFWAWLFLQYDIKKISPAEAAYNISIPVLLIHSQDDDVIPFEHALLLQKSMSHNSHLKTVFIKGARHGEIGSDHTKVISDFFAKNL